ncbi:MAG: hypothetical protein ABL973_01250 [Micropepsaceae bacterium]
MVAAVKNVLLFPFLMMLQLVRCWVVFYVFYLLLGLLHSISNPEVDNSNVALDLLRPGAISFLQVVTVLCSPVIVWPKFPLVTPIVQLLWSIVVGHVLTQIVWFLYGFWGQDMGLSQYLIEFVRFGDADRNYSVLVFLAVTVCAGAFAAAGYLALGSFLHWYYTGLRWVMRPLLALFLGWKSAKDFFDPAAGLEPFAN